jgi:predicted PurR-regulated permease PerM
MAARSRPPSAVEIVLKLLGAIAGAIVLGYLLWGIRSLLLPVVVGALLAYICSPLVVGLERYRVTRGLAIGLLLLAFLSAALLIATLVRAGIPTEIRALDFRTRALHKTNERYRTLMGLDASPRGNRLYRLVHDDVEPVMDRISRLLALSSDERARFLEAHTLRPEDSAALLDFDRDNLQALARRGLAPTDGGIPEGEARSEAFTLQPRRAKTPLASLAAILSTWVIAPTVFLFLLRDTGEIKRAFLALVPNRLFEPALAVLADLDGALGSYLRGVFLECASLGLALALLFAVVGIPILWAVALGFVAGATNVIPYVGSAVALVAGLSYTLLADIHPLLSIVNANNVAIFLVAGVLLIEILKNVVVEPLVLGGAASLHPLIVVIGVLGGGILFGLPGLLLAIPTITIVKAFVSSASAQLKAYGLI